MACTLPRADQKFIFVTASTDQNFGFWEVENSQSQRMISGDPHRAKKIGDRISEVPHFGTQDSDLLKWIITGVYAKLVIVGYNDDIIDVKFIPPQSKDSRRGLQVAAQHGSKPYRCCTNSPDLRIVDLNTFDCELVSGHSDIVLAVDASPDGRWIASVSKDRTVRLWCSGPMGKHHLAATGVGHTEAVGAISFGKKPHAYLERSMGNSNPLLISGSQD